MELLAMLSQAVFDGDMEKAVELTRNAISQGTPVSDILELGLISAMHDIGDKFKRGEIFVPEMLIAARAMNRALEILEPEMIRGKIESKGTFIIGAVKGDLHDIGKNLVGIMFKGAGFRVIDLGTDVSLEAFIKAAREHNPDIIGISSLLTTTMPYMQTVIEGLRSEGIRARVIIGGAPVNREFAQSIKADGYAENAAEAADLGKSLMGL
jgi:5-methyltetrahydrofolate--homocysteine methyltransferase